MYGIGICVLLIGLLVFDIFFALVVALSWRSGERAINSRPAGERARYLFLLRVAPSLGAVLCVGTLLAPAFFANEPRETAEELTIKIVLLAGVSLCAISVSLWRVVAAWILTRRLVRRWMEQAEAIRIEKIDVPTYLFNHPFPVIAIVGTIHPRLFVARQVFQALSPEELSAAIAHEKGHLAARDTIKAGLIRACRDLLAISSPGRLLARAWAEAAEASADEKAAGEGKAVALNLASALVKVARLVPQHNDIQALPVASFLIAEDMGNIAARVCRLTELAAHPRQQPVNSGNVRTFALLGALSGLLSGLILSISDLTLLTSIYSALECVVAALQ